MQSAYPWLMPNEVPLPCAEREPDTHHCIVVVSYFTRLFFRSLPTQPMPAVEGPYEYDQCTG